ncbi:hypothetical protein D3C76_1347580 [compost metagenome]
MFDECLRRQIFRIVQVKTIDRVPVQNAPGQDQVVQCLLGGTGGRDGAQFFQAFIGHAARQPGRSGFGQHHRLA